MYNPNTKTKGIKLMIGFNNPITPYSSGVNNLVNIGNKIIEPALIKIFENVYIVVPLNKLIDELDRIIPPEY